MTSRKKTAAPKVARKKPRCTAVDDHGNRCAGADQHPGAHGSTGGTWWRYPENAAGATSVADAALAVLQRPGERRRVDLPQESDKRLREELYAAGFLLEDESTLSGVRALLQSRARLLDRVTELERAQEKPLEKTFTASRLREMLNLPNGVDLSVRTPATWEEYGDVLVHLDDDEQVLVAGRMR